MPYSVYIDVVEHPPFQPGDKDVEVLMSRVLGINVKFICNSYARISKGDIYEIPFENSEDVTVFVLKCEYDLVDRDKVEQYKNRDPRVPINYYLFK